MTSQVTIPPVEKLLSPMALGGSLFGPDEYRDEKAAVVLETMAAALKRGINHFDTASDYGAGESERLIGRFMAGQRERVFVGSKAGPDEMDADVMLAHIDRSLERLQTDHIDLYYIHWPRSGKDPRPLMEGLERARAQGKVGAVGVSNFSVEQMELARQAGRIDAHQLCYNLLWRFAEAELIPYCVQHHIAVITYSSIAQGVLTGKFPREPQLAPGDQRARTVHFEPEVWPHIYEAVESFRLVAQRVDCPLTHLAIRWVLAQPGIHTAVVSARTPVQLHDNADALTHDIPESALADLSAISDAAMRHIPDTGNLYRYYP